MGKLVLNDITVPYMKLENVDAEAFWAHPLIYPLYLATFSAVALTVRASFTARAFRTFLICSFLTEHVSTTFYCR